MILINKYKWLCLRIINMNVFINENLPFEKRKFNFLKSDVQNFYLKYFCNFKSIVMYKYFANVSVY
jgi:hypothetical protein